MLVIANIKTISRNCRYQPSARTAAVEERAVKSGVSRLRACESETVAERLVDDLQRFTEGSTHDELGWKPIQLHAVQILNARRKVVVSTVDEQRRNRDLLDHARDDRYDVVTVPDRIRDELSSTDDIDGNTIRDVSVYQNEYEDSFEFTWVTEGELGEHEQQIWDLRHDLFEIVSHPAGYKFRIAQQFRATDDSTQGLHQGRDQRIIVHRDVLTNASTFLGVLLHELAHTRTPFPDQTREFENALTDLLGEVGQVAVHKQ